VRLGRKTALREKAEARARKHLERVQLHMVHWVRPRATDATNVATAV
jgi:hypothetical protein